MIFIICNYRSTNIDFDTDLQLLTLTKVNEITNLCKKDGLRCIIRKDNYKLEKPKKFEHYHLKYRKCIAEAETATLLVFDSEFKTAREEELIANADWS